MPKIRKIREGAGHRLGKLFTDPISPASGDSVLSEMPELKSKLILDSVNYLLGKLVPGLMGFLSVFVFVRLLGYEGYGRYAVVFAVVMASSSGMAAWLGQGILRFQSLSKDSYLASRFSTAVSLGTLLSLVFGMAGLASAFLLSHAQHGSTVLISVILFGGVLLYTLTIAQFQAKLDSRAVLRFEIIRSIAVFAVPALLMLVGRFRDYRVLLLGVAAGYLSPLLSRISFFKPGARARWLDAMSGSSEEWKVLRKVWSFGWPVAIWMLCQQGLLVSDRLFIQRYSGYADAGIYSSMYDVIVRSFSLLFMPVTLAVHPLVMNRWNAGKPKHAVKAIRSAVKYQLLMFLPIGAALVAVGPWVSHVVLGKPIHGAAQIVMPLALSGFLWQTSLLAHKPLEMLCETKRMLVGMLVALTINVLGNWLLVPIYSYKASAYLAVASSLTYLLSVFVLTPRAKFVAALKAEAIIAPSINSSMAEDCAATLT